MNCDIVIPVWNQLDVTKDCIERIFRNTSYPYRLIIVDNASDAATKEYLYGLRDDPRITLIRNDRNLGFVKAVNQGMRLSDSPYLCVMNNDTLPAPGWLNELVKFAETHPDVGIMNPLCGSPAGYTLESYSEHIKSNSGKYMEMNQCFLFCALIKKEVVKKIGYLDESFGMGGYDDTDYSRRAHEVGYRCVSVHSSYVKHLDGTSFRALGNRDAINAANEKIYFKKWPRHLRVAAIFSLNTSISDGDVESIMKTVLSLARDWCWVNLWIFGDKDTCRRRIEEASAKINMPVHQNIKMTYFKGFKALSSLARVLERSFGTKRRKKYDVILCDDGRVSSLLKMFASLHGGVICTTGSTGKTGFKDALEMARSR